MRKVHVYVSLILLCGLVVSCSGETLKELLFINHLPLAPFSQSELMELVQGLGRSNGQEAVIAYRKSEGEFLVGPLHLLRYDKVSGILLRSEGPAEETNVCSGSIEEISFIGQFTLMSTSLSPSAECLLVLDKDLKVHKVLFGFSPVEVAPGLVVIIENMIHFAPVHPERLQLDDLADGTTTELYPGRIDALRERFIAAHAKHMPTDAICKRSNDPCDPEMFDEDVQSLGTDGKGQFAFVVLQSASHETAPQGPPVTVAAQTVLYIYSRNPVGWSYCEVEIPDSLRESLVNSLHSGLGGVAGRCTPTLPVVPDRSTAE